ncbi:MAG: hypothetical protein EOM62_14530 [Bacteroidia bacterium]|nr:hypothetical protein [Bacteroidia bacterium]
MQLIRPIRLLTLRLFLSAFRDIPVRFPIRGQNVEQMRLALRPPAEFGRSEFPPRIVPVSIMCVIIREPVIQVVARLASVSLSRLETTTSNFVSISCAMSHLVVKTGLKYHIPVKEGRSRSDFSRHRHYVPSREPPFAWG